MCARIRLQIISYKAIGEIGLKYSKDMQEGRGVPVFPNLHNF